MKFYCPNCQTEQDLEPQNQLTTPHGQVYLKATCPVCRQDLSELANPVSDSNSSTNPSPNL